MKIGKLNLVTRRPTDLDAQLAAEFGCSAAEVAELLTQTPLAGTVARALMPFLADKDRADVFTWATRIAEAGISAVAAEVVALYGAAPAAEAGE